MRGIAAVLAFAVCFQSAAFAGVKHVCRYSGRILAPCECPEEKAGAPGVSRASCCTVKPAQLPGLPEARVVPAVDAVAPVAEPTVASELPGLAPAHRVAFVASAHGPPRLYVRHRQLLL